MYRLLLYSLIFSPIILVGQSAGLAPAGARGVALGGVGLTFTEVQSVWSNPAGLAYLEEFSAAVFGEQRYGQSELKQANAAFAIPSSSGAFAVSLGYFGFSAYNEQTVGIAYARNLLDRLSIGVQVFAFSVRIPDYGNRIRPAFEIGLYSPVTDELKLGLRVRNPMQIELIEGENLASSVGFGLQYAPNPSLGILAEVEKDIRAELRFRGGMEYSLGEDLQLRLGIATAPTLISFGTGYRITEKLLFDVAASYHTMLGISPGVGIRYSPSSK